MKVHEVIEKSCNKVDVTWVSVAYSETRTINDAMNREAIGYIIGFKSFLVIFRKRGGFLAYRGFSDNYDWTIKSSPISIKEAIKHMNRCIKDGIGKVYLDDNFKKEFVIENL